MHRNFETHSKLLIIIDIYKKNINVSQFHKRITNRGTFLLEPEINFDIISCYLIPM